MGEEGILSGYSTLTNVSAAVRSLPGEETAANIVLDSLSSGMGSVTGYFGLSSFPFVQAVLVPDRREFDRLVRDLLKVQIEVPSHPARIAQVQRTHMILLSPGAYASESTFTFEESTFKMLVIHEFVHMVEEHISPNIEASPHWWGEGLAVYLSGQWRYDESFRKPAAEMASRGHIPSLESVLSGGVSPYDWGWTLVRFIEDRLGAAEVARVVRECNDGDVISLLGMEHMDFERLWHEWIRLERSLQ